MLKLKSTARLKRRYLLLRGKKESIEEAILAYIGILGWAKAAPVIAPTKEGKVILVVNRSEITNVRAALGLSADEIIVLRVSGTLKGLGERVTSANLK